MKFAAAIAGALLGALFFWLIWPAPIDPVRWDEPEAPALTGVLEPRGRLASAAVTPVAAPRAAEGVSLGPDGRLYLGTHDGRIMRLSGTDIDSAVEEVTQAECDIVMGVDWISDQELGYASTNGLFAYNIETGEHRSLSTGTLAYPFGFVNDLAAAPDGTVYFTDSSTRWGHSSERPGYFYDMLENRPHGLVYAWDPVWRTTRVVADRLYYPNGVVVDPDGEYILVSETWRYRIKRIWVAGPRQGQVDTLAENLPGMPDGLAIGPDGQLFIAMSNQRSELLTWLRRRPFWLEQLIKLPAWVRPGAGPTTSFILVMDRESGAYLDSFHDADGRLNYISAIQPAADGSIWFGSTDASYVARFVPPMARREHDADQPVAAQSQRSEAPAD